MLRAYYHGWVFNKISAWKESIDTHILRLEQVEEMVILKLSAFLFYRLHVILTFIYIFFKYGISVFSA